ncbi:GNAT family N-acetyltransferase [Brevibacillus fulvus]|uniref:Ribosomal protein S18 acetylase RimI-like enzyme n=1 Tax=Brevibacillus fulvus TaxID=1125967 RepID=A0A939BUG0_9BACL|nr:GNAT family N-acetyltransferase [Brevibacillus fulvus]MBM7589516.1 ribosomal protein S18 acetylase RimI-like enzyme [Brevibacillus fulvus]
MCIRQAKKEDAAAAALLLAEVLEHIGTTLAGTAEPVEKQQILQSFFTAERNRLSYRQTDVKVQGDKVVGMVVSYHGSEAEMLDQPIVERLRRLKQDSAITIDREADLDDYYIDALCVDRNVRGQGIGSQLIRAVEEKARQRGFETIALNVEHGNIRAYQLYQKLGYRTRKDKVISGGKYHYMVKNLL